MPGSAEARGVVKAARFLAGRTGVVQLRALWGASGSLVTSPLVRLSLEQASRPPLWRAHNRKDKTMKTETKNARPTHRIFAVTGTGNKKFWQPIGALWAHSDGKGFNQRLDYLPLNNAEIVIRVIEDDAQAEGYGGAQ